MGSVIASWSGTCRDTALRTELVAFLQELAEASEERFELPEVPRPAYLEISTADMERIAGKMELVRVFDMSLSGRVLLDSSIAKFERLPADSQAGSISLEKPSVWPESAEGSCSCAAFSDAADEWHSASVPGLRLVGIDFRLYDPRGLYPAEDRISFVFIDCPAAPALDGQIVFPTNRAVCLEYDHELIQTADWYLVKPTIHLHYLEDWFDFLLTWVKAFYIPELNYWNKEDLHQHELFKSMIDALVTKHGEAFGKQSTFEFLLERFDIEADNWGQNVASMADELGQRVDNLPDSDVRPLSSYQFTPLSAEGHIAAAYAKLFSRTPRRAAQAAKELVACGPEAFPAIRRALIEPRLELRWDDLLVHLRSLAEHAAPLAPDVVRFLDGRAGEYGPSCGGDAAYLLGKMGEKSHAAVKEWMERTSPALWEAWLETFLSFSTAADVLSFLGSLISGGHGVSRIWACKFITERVGWVNYDREPLSFESLISIVLEQIPGADEWLRGAAIEALVSIGQPAVEIMWAMTDARRADVRAAGLEALARYVCQPHEANTINIDDRDIFSHLASKLTDPEPMVRVAAAIALQKIAVGTTNQLLSEKMQTLDRDLQIRIAEGFQESFLDPTGLESLRAAIKDHIFATEKHPFASRRIAAVDLATSPERSLEASSPLLEGLRDWHDPWRHKYLEAIRRAGKRARAAIPAVLVCTAADARIQVLAFRALAAIGEATDEVVARAIDCLEARDFDVRSEALRFLSVLGKGAAAATSAIEASAGTESLRRLALFALMQIDTEEARAAAQRISRTIERKELLQAEQDIEDTPE